MSAGLPLSGVRVVDLGVLIAGPAVASTLADLGADVIKIEPEGGEMARHVGPMGAAIFHAYNRGKRSVSLDLRSDAGRSAAEQIICASDVVIQNSRPGAMDRLGLGADQVLKMHPRCVYLDLSAFGSVDAGRAGFDVIAQAESGMMSITGTPDREPQRVGFPIVDVATAMYGVQAVLAALFRRERTGQGGRIELSLIESAVSIQAPLWTQMFQTDEVPTRGGNPQPSVAPGSDLFETKDGVVVISAYSDPHFRALTTALGLEGMVDDARFSSLTLRVANRDRMNNQLAQAIQKFCTDEAVSLLSDAGVAVGTVRGYADVPTSDFAQSLGLFEEVNGIPTVRLPYRIDGQRTLMDMSAPPELGADTKKVLEDFAPEWSGLADSCGGNAESALTEGEA